MTTKKTTKKTAPSKIPAIDSKKSTKEDFTAAVKMIDAFVNNAARMGYNTASLMEGTTYPITRVTRDYNLINSLYRSHWVVRRVIDTIPEDMCKNWYTLNCQLTPEEIGKYQKAERITKTKTKLEKGLKWGRLYGGAAGIILIKGHEDILDQPLDLDSIMPDSYCGMYILDRWSGISPNVDKITDIGDPEYGLPNSYRITINPTYETHVDVHHSRIVRFIGRELPEWEAAAEMWWGCSEIEIIFDELKKRDNTSWNIANLIFQTSIKVLKMGKLREALSMTSGPMQQAMYNTLQAQSQMIQTNGMMVLNDTDDFTVHNQTFSGLDKIYESFMLDLAGACKTPVTKLFGRSPEGFNSSGEGQQQDYNNTIAGEQSTYFEPAIHKLAPIICMSALGYIPDDFDIMINPYREITSREQKDLAKSQVDSIVAAYNAGLISQQTAMKELRQMEDETGMFTNIQDEDIEAADNDIQSKADLMPMLKGFKSSSSGGKAGTEKATEIGKANELGTTAEN